MSEDTGTRATDASVKKRQKRRGRKRERYVQGRRNITNADEVGKLNGVECKHVGRYRLE